jgi:hypothetical protein
MHDSLFKTKTFIAIVVGTVVGVAAGQFALWGMGRVATGGQ